MSSWGHDVGVCIWWLPESKPMSLVRAYKQVSLPADSGHMLQDI